MIKIDFHIHTITTERDSHFEFCMETLKRYVYTANLDAIAITNHNTFDLEQYKQIADAVKAKVYPGIEINLEAGHLLLISDTEELDDFSDKCSQVKNKVEMSEKERISVDEFKKIFPDLNKYILIPHYKKDPEISQDVIQQLKQYIYAGEVQSTKKFKYCFKGESYLVPLYFSDSRMSKDLSTLPVRQTFLGCPEVSFKAIKNCFMDKRKVALSPNESIKFFQIFDNGQMLSTGLNVVLGERSSGKSYTLDKIYSEQSSLIDVKYIEQFSLVARDKKEDEKKFDKILQKKHSLLSRDYLEPLKIVVDDIIDVDLNADYREISNYVESLVKNAQESDRHDTFSKAKLYSEEEFPILEHDGLIDLINSTKNLVSNREFREIIKEYVSIEELTKLYVKLMKEYTKREEIKLKQKYLNELIDEIKEKLTEETATTRIDDIDIYKIVINKKKVEKFNRVVELAKYNRIIENKDLKGFKLIAKSCSFKGAGDLQKICHIKVAFSEAYKKYNNPYEYLQKLKDAGIEEAEFHKFFAKIEYKILNKDGFEVSGGERSEFNLLQEIHDAQAYDMLLIDEPESSFDNLFLKKEVNEMIRNIAQNMPVVIVTHNNTVGASINPDYTIYTKKEVEKGKIVHRVYSGTPESKTLLSTDGQRIDTYSVIMDCLEAGNNTYKERSDKYENLKS